MRIADDYKRMGNGKEKLFSYLYDLRVVIIIIIIIFDFVSTSLGLFRE